MVLTPLLNLAHVRNRQAAAVLLITSFSIEIHIMKVRVMPMPLIYAFTALIGAVVLPLLIGSKAILPILMSTPSAAICIFGSIFAAFAALSYASKVPLHFIDTGEGEGGGQFWMASLSMSLGLGLSFLAGYVLGVLP